MRHARLRPDALGDQGIGDPACRTVERTVGRDAPLVDDRRHIGLPPAMGAHDIGKACNLDGHPGVFPLFCLACSVGRGVGKIQEGTSEGGIWASGFW
jgi:hypothetical protein